MEILTKLGRRVCTSLSKDIVQSLSKEISNYMKKLEQQDIAPEDRFTFDRIEGDVAILENRESGKMVEVSKDALDESTKPGQILRYENSKFVPCLEETEEAKQKIQSLVRNLYEK